jgi:hypothetical protein
MDRSRRPSHRLLALTLAVALVGSVGGLIGCDSGTQEPDAPTPSNEFGATGSTPAAEQPATPQAQPPRDGTIAPERFPTELPEGITAEIPYNFPSSVPIYPGAQPAQGRGAEIEGAPVSGVQLLSNDTPAEIFDFYERELQANGWTIDESNSEGMAGSIMASKDGCKAAIFVQSSPQGGSDIFVINEC